MDRNLQMNEKEIKELWSKLKKYPNVIGFDSTPRHKIKGGQELPVLALRIYVKKKVPLSAFVMKPTLAQRIKHFFKKNPLLVSDLIPPEINGIPTDVIEIGEVRALNEQREHRRPIVAGISGCHKDCTACTISGFFRKDDKVLVALNNHCGAEENTAKKGDPWIQPSPYDGGLYPQDEFARLESFVEIKFEEFECPWRNIVIQALRKITRRSTPLNKVDIALGIPTVEYTIDAFKIPNAFIGSREPTIGEKVCKIGRTTGYTEGIVESTNVTVQVQYSRGTAVFTDCIMVRGTNFSAGGDSGSPVFDMNGNVVGILFAGADTYTILCKISNIEKETGSKLVTKS